MTFKLKEKSINQLGYNNRNMNNITTENKTEQKKRDLKSVYANQINLACIACKMRVLYILDNFVAWFIRRLGLFNSKLVKLNRYI